MLYSAVSCSTGPNGSITGGDNELQKSQDDPLTGIVLHFSFIDDKRVFKSINGLVYLRNNEAGLEDVSLNIGESDFRVNGIFKNIVDYFSGVGNLNTDIQITGNKINIEDLGADAKEDILERGRQFVLPYNIDGTVLLDVEVRWVLCV